MKEKKMEKVSLVEVLVIWRNRQMKVQINSSSDIKELGMELVKLSNVKPETMKLLVPLSADKGSKLVIPFSAEHSSLTLQEAAIPEGKPIRMMGVFEREIEEVSKNSKPDLRIVGFDEEEKRLRKRLLDRPQSFLKLPQGVYIFCDFRTLHIPGIELNPPPSEALRRMHMLACDPGIIAIMNKHRWRVGIMTEMAPEGYVGISPKCLLGFNKNHGEEISLRLRTDDLKGLRKYESIKKTLLHELAHMVHSEHDANFFALNKQLNQEAESLDWTKSRSHSLSGRKTSNHYEDEVVVQSSYHNTGQKLGGTTSMSSSSARASSVAAAYNRYFVMATTSMEETKIDMESKTKDVVHVLEAQELTTAAEPDPDDKIMKIEPDPDDPLDGTINFVKCESYGAESDPDGAILIVEDDMQVDSLMYGAENAILGSFHNEAQGMVDHVESFNEMPSSFKEPDPDESLASEARLSFKESDPNEYETERTSQIHASAAEPDPDDAESIKNEIQVENLSLGKLHEEPDPDKCKPEVESVLQTSQSLTPEPYPDDNIDCSENHELMRIEESVAVVCERLQKAIETLRSEVTPTEATSSLQTLFKIIKNVIEHPDNVKFRRLRKGNPSFQSNVANHKVAVEVLSVVGFCEDVLTDEIGRSETYMVLKRNDPGLLWLAKSTLESIA